MSESNTEWMGVHGPREQLLELQRELSRLEDQSTDSPSSPSHSPRTAQEAAIIHAAPHIRVDGALYAYMLETLREESRQRQAANARQHHAQQAGERSALACAEASGRASVEADGEAALAAVLRDMVDAKGVAQKAQTQRLYKEKLAGVLSSWRAQESAHIAGLDQMLSDEAAAARSVLAAQQPAAAAMQHQARAALSQARYDAAVFGDGLSRQVYYAGHDGAQAADMYNYM